MARKGLIHPFADVILGFIVAILLFTELSAQLQIFDPILMVGSAIGGLVSIGVMRMIPILG